MIDLKHGVAVSTTVVPATHNANVEGTGVDLQGYHGALIAITPGTITDGTHTPKAQESANNTDWTDVDAGDLIGTLATITSDTVQTVGYRGNQRYVRVYVTVTPGASGGAYGAVVVRSNPRKAPLA